MTKKESREEYLRQLRERQKKHLEGLSLDIDLGPCAHESCPHCHGTGIKGDGTPCVHFISCGCPRCTPTF
jgi:hypothetical protein